MPPKEKLYQGFVINAHGPIIVSNGHQEEIQIHILNPDNQVHEIWLEPMTQTSTPELKLEFFDKKGTPLPTYAAAPSREAKERVNKSTLVPKQEIVLAMAFRNDSQGASSNPLHSAASYRWSLKINGEVKSGLVKLQRE